jgi:hypothetical protein
VNPDDLARLLGAAIGKELPEPERVPLRYEIARWAEREHLREKRDHQPRHDGSDPASLPDSDDLLEKLLNAMEHPLPRELDE